MTILRLLQKKTVSVSMVVKKHTPIKQMSSVNILMTLYSKHALFLLSLLLLLLLLFLLFLLLLLLLLLVVVVVVGGVGCVCVCVCVCVLSLIHN